MFDAIRMLGNNFPAKASDVVNTINQNSNEKFTFWITFTTYLTFILAFFVVTIALNNILIGLSVNLAREGLAEARYHRLNAMAQNICWIDLTIKKTKAVFKKCWRPE